MEADKISTARNADDVDGSEVAVDGKSLNEQYLMRNFLIRILLRLSFDELKKLVGRGR